MAKRANSYGSAIAVRANERSLRVNVPFCVAIVLLCLTLVSMHLTGGLFARYSTTSEVEDSARVAVMGSDVSFDVTVYGICPGETMDINFQVTNQEGGRVCEVAQSYTISIDRFEGVEENLPLTWELYEADGAKVDSPSGSLRAGEAETDGYCLKVTWPANLNAASYAFEVDALEITIDAEQVD